ncbi:Archaeal primase DnaG/twinkle, TOPRIM domain [uncultured Caudovirales phage]|uniref:Archaeal primase DnaG/twinkle, TOPRIM domain n=1 Tax=uncultured Caudovirales phage TaxID=2100421 RepID=A0A6J5LD58_9CAUD|nr:Archaeal primase DnaG/twinkle, TOPRIM domain [uncultured Caudovirales phage]
MFSAIKDFILDKLPSGARSASNGWVSFNAVCCHNRGESVDTRRRGGVHPNPDGSISYSCFNCGFTASYFPGRPLNGRIRQLLGWMGASEAEVKRLVIEALRLKELGIVPSIRAPEEQSIDFDEMALPEHSSEIVELAKYYEETNWENSDRFIQAVEYINSRRIAFGESPDAYKFYLTPETANNLHRRLLLPFYWNDKIVGYTARAMDDGVKPKYLNRNSPNYVFNMNRQKPSSKFVIVCEGPFDALSINGVSVLGNTISDVQVDIIDGLGKEVIVVPDFDITENSFGKAAWPGSKLLDRALEVGWEVSFPIWSETCKDINAATVKYGKLFVLNSILSARQSSKLKIELKKKEYLRKT